MGSGDEGIMEVLTEWVDKDPDDSKWDLYYGHKSGRRLVKKLKSIGWTVPKGFRYRRVPNWGNEQVWKSDFAGANNNQIDSVDLVLFQGHGIMSWDAVYKKNLKALQMGEKAVVVPGDAIKKWGDKDLEWIGLQSCQILGDTSRSYWANALNGAHLILGWATNALDVKAGAKWGKYMKKGLTVTQAWFVMADKLHPKGRMARVIAETGNNFSDHVWGIGKYVSPDPTVDQYYYFLDHKVGSGPPLARENDQNSMPLYRVIPQDINLEYVESIASALGVSGEIVEEDDGFSMNTDDKYLEVNHTGSVYYIDSARLWIPFGLPDVNEPNEIPEEFPTPHLLDTNESMAMAEELLARLRTHDLFANLSEGGVFDGVISDVLSEGQKESDEVINVVETGRQVLYARELDGYSVVGPGARMKVYIGEPNEIIGFQGGWRQVEHVGEIPIMPEDEVLRLLNSYSARVVLSGISKSDTMNIVDSTLGYYELPQDEYRFSFGSQDDVLKDELFLIPAYIFTVEYVDGDESSIDYVHVPAAPEFIPPVVDIISPEDDSELIVGQTIELEAEVLFGTPPYEYSWQTDYGTILGSDASVRVTPLDAIREIRLTVADAEGREGSDSIRFARPAGPQPVTVLAEDFEGLALGPNVDEALAGDAVWTDTPPEGWTIDESGIPGIGDPATDGVTEWAGWAFANKDWWIETAGDQDRSLFTLGIGTVAIADPDEWDDQDHAGKGRIQEDPYDTWLSTRPIDISYLAAGTLQLKFDSSWRPEFDDNYHQTANVTVSFDGGEPIEVLLWESDEARPNYKPYATNETVIVDLGNPAEAKTAVVTFGLFDAGNDWWWAIDNLDISGIAPERAPVDTAGLLALWTCDEGEGAVVADISGNGRDGIFVNGDPAWVEGVEGTAVELIGPTLIETPPLDLELTEATMAGWIKPYGPQPDWSSFIMQRDPGLATGFNILGYQLAYHWNDTSDSWSFRGGDMIAEDEWTFAAVTIEPDKAQFYVNGEAGSVNEISHGPCLWNSNVYLGGDGTEGWVSRRMIGALDNVAIYDRALSAEEIGYLASLR